MAYQRYACPEAGCAVWARVISTSNLLPAQRKLEVATQVVKSIADWRAQSDETHVFTMEGTDAPVATDSAAVQAEQRTWYVGERHLVAEDTGDRTTWSPAPTARSCAATSRGC
ncbi:Uncharacterised protein [Amycolatopsis camponoti]|uniref:Uncharacterized protein n=1 Tax=Amycolatopsis camponoti TaxID=2606593 RepID=A0A6I8LNP0_9PSEU|nr:hypothetical protein [Amycolatopsis camponoti]VVJ18612.1 Uncharacterised protein [Amycolatopsis camponoti]